MNKLKESAAQLLKLEAYINRHGVHMPPVVEVFGKVLDSMEELEKENAELRNQLGLLGGDE